MNNPRHPDQSPDILRPPLSSDFGEIRREVAHKLFNDPSYDVFDAMGEMSQAAEDFIRNASRDYPDTTLWVGGSLGRREMLPNSDIDLFVVYDGEDYEESGIRIEGVDKFELGHISTSQLKKLLSNSLVDANRFIDGRRVGLTPAPHVEQMIDEVNTQDRQLANNISEYFYYRYFDFPQKTTPIGPNLKYSTGSSRDTIFFNMIARMGSGSFPATRSTEPELAEVLRYTEEHYGLKAPREAINLMFIAKNAAISVYDKTSDERSKYVSSYGLEAIYDFCEAKFKALGIKDATHFISAYSAARQEIEFTVDTLFTKALSEHPAASELEALLSLPPSELAAACISPDTRSSEYRHSVTSLAAWLTMMSSPSPDDMGRIAAGLTEQPIEQVWGGIMAVVCSPATKDATLQELADWLYVNENGAYLTKLITRNPAASPETRQRALAYYRDKEIIT